MPIPSIKNAMNIVFSRPSLSDTQPKNGLAAPLNTRSIDSAKVSAGNVRPTRVTSTLATLKSSAICARFAVASSPPTPMRTNMTYMIQNVGVPSISVQTNCLRSTSWARGLGNAATTAASGCASKKPRTSTTRPCPSPKYRKVAEYPLDLIIIVIGMTVAAEPAPKPAAVMPAARPRRSGNHLSALATHVPYTAPAPMPAIAWPTYSTNSELAIELIDQPTATSTPPATVTTRGPKRSTR